MKIADVIERSDAISPHLVPIAPAAPDVCPYCRTAKDDRHPLCYRCGQIETTFGLTCPRVLLVSYYTKPGNDEPPSMFREMMHGYKEHEDPDVRASFALDVGALVARTLIAHEETLLDRFGAWEIAATIPSTKHPGQHPLADALDHFAEVVEPPQRLLAGWLSADPTAGTLS